MKHKLSPWYSADTKPVHVGVYKRSNGYYSMWNGTHWGWNGSTPSEAEIFIKPSNWQHRKWRGIVK